MRWLESDGSHSVKRLRVREPLVFQLLNRPVRETPNTRYCLAFLRLALPLRRNG